MTHLVIEDIFEPLLELVNNPNGILIGRAPTPHSPYWKLYGRMPNKRWFCFKMASALFTLGQ